MSNRVWFSSVMEDYRIGYKQGLRAKFLGEDWEPARHESSESEKVFAAMQRHTQGYALGRHDLPEAIAVFDKKRFKLVGDLFIAGRFFAARERLAEVLARFDLGSGSLVPFQICQDDLKTPIEEKFYYINLGARKRTFLPTESKSVELLVSNKETGSEIWKINSWAKDGDVALSSAALDGPDLWVEEIVRHKLFLTEELVSSLLLAKLKIDLQLTECRLMEREQ
ncbi:hypothetical protein SSBR45G_70510 [Bradyrhizobium sp. SSBR45G]|uniref:hypothetical protein n=1 Tax=unclassified Bradyrhizobium TaxID=2631580 RepID=UPI0023429980|nr:MULTISPECIES: hypothetical protein [unclassified Bradyrhizobium]GLH82142.1 hypothetical protein SSBR45G_70510 [Bradyrhizobium sp. SSBR45G]GLH89571.1 hypothetical protein SSBR45R_70320 [Bradyrhizobium sp. SSBR45R]